MLRRLAAMRVVAPLRRGVWSRSEEARSRPARGARTWGRCSATTWSPPLRGELAQDAYRRALDVVACPRAQVAKLCGTRVTYDPGLGGLWSRQPACFSWVLSYDPGLGALVPGACRTVGALTPWSGP